MKILSSILRDNVWFSMIFNEHVKDAHNDEFEFLTVLSSKFNFEFLEDINKEVESNHLSLSEKGSERIPLLALRDVLKTYKFIQEIWEHMLDPSQAKGLVPLTLGFFGQYNQYKGNFDERGLGDDKGKKVVSLNNKSLTVKNLTDSLNDSSNLYFDGIDFILGNSSPNHIGSRLNDIQNILSDNLEPANALIYQGKRSGMSDDLTKILTSNDFSGEFHQDVADNLSEYIKTNNFKEKGLSVFSLSNGVIQSYSVLFSALKTKLKESLTPEEINEVYSKVRAVNFAVIPLWGENNEHEFASSINIFSATDIFGPSSRVFRGLISQYALGEREETGFLFHPENENLMAIIISPEDTHQEIKYSYYKEEMGSEKSVNLINTGSHQMPHILASLGLLENKTPQNYNLKKAGEIIRKYSNGKLDLKEKSLKARFEEAGIQTETLDIKKLIEDYDPELPQNCDKNISRNVIRILCESLFKQHIATIKDGGDLNLGSPLLKTAIASLNLSDGKSLYTNHKKNYNFGAE